MTSVDSQRGELLEQYCVLGKYVLSARYIQALPWVLMLLLQRCMLWAARLYSGMGSLRKQLRLNEVARVGSCSSGMSVFVGLALSFPHGRVWRKGDVRSQQEGSRLQTRKAELSLEIKPCQNIDLGLSSL